MGRLKNFFISLPDNKLFWFLTKPFSKLGYVWWTFRERREECRRFYEEHERRQKRFASLFSDLTVKHGPFKGVRYPSFSSAGSSLYAKLLGSYEREIHPVLEELCQNRYTEILNIGCAEGYYSVGLAKRIPEAKIVAYDIDDEARRLSAQMAEHNGVADRIEIRKEMTPQELGTFPFTGPGLIICDCEGFERTLFQRSNIGNLVNCDLIIETHDFISLGISNYLEELFEDTHDLSFIQSIDDIQKLKHYSYAELEPYDLEQRKILIGEGRPAIMEWMIGRRKPE